VTIIEPAIAIKINKSRKGAEVKLLTIMKVMFNYKLMKKYEKFLQLAVKMTCDQVH